MGLSVLALALACQAGGEDTGGSAGPIVLRDDQNYAFAATLDGPSFPVVEAADVLLDWSGCTTDMRCEALDPEAEVDTLGLYAFPALTEAEVEAGLVSDALRQEDLGGYVSVAVTGATSAHLSDFTFFGTDPDVEALFLEGSATWLLTLATGDPLTGDVRMVAFLEPRADATATQVDLPPGCGVVDLEVDLRSSEPVPVEPAGPWVVDWSALTVDGRGQPLSSTAIDQVVLASFADTDLAALEAGFLGLESFALTWQELDVASGQTADLAQLGLERLDPERLWMLGLVCGGCLTPAPLFLGRLEP